MNLDPQAVEDIKQRIARLQSMETDCLESAMDDLKAALMENPAASNMLLPAEIGEMVAALRKITGEAVMEATKTKKTKAAKDASANAVKALKSLTEEDMKDIFDEL